MRLTQWNATIKDETGSRILLHLMQDKDGFRWYEDETDKDTEISGETEQDAIDAAEIAWKSWGIQIIDCEEGI